MRCNRCEGQLEEDKARCRRCGHYTFQRKADEEDVFKSLADVEDLHEQRILADTWWGPLFGGGFVQSQRILLAGEAGAGKSTWSVIVGEAAWVETGLPTLYIATEERPVHIKARCQRLGVNPAAFRIINQHFDDPLDCLDTDQEFGLGILDSLPDLVGDNPHESIEALGRISDWVASCEAPFLIIDHVNKGEEMAGLYRLRHAVDTTVYLRSRTDSPERLMEIHKNRHGGGHQLMKLSMRGEADEFPGLLEPTPDRARRGMGIVKFVPPPITVKKRKDSAKKPNGT